MKLISIVIALLSILFGIQLFAMVDISIDSFDNNLKTKTVVKTKYVPDSANIEYESYYKNHGNVNEVN